MKSYLKIPIFAGVSIFLICAAIGLISNAISDHYVSYTQEEITEKLLDCRIYDYVCVYNHLEYDKFRGSEKDNFDKWFLGCVKAMDSGRHVGECMNQYTPQLLEWRGR